MRVLIAGRNAKLLATTAGAFSDDLTIETAATKAACIALLERTEFDVVIACETLGDGSGLEVLSHAAVNTPNALRIFAARPSTLNLLKGELGLFGLFRTLPYPISFRKLWAALDLARSCCADGEQTGVRIPVESGEAVHAASQSHDEVQVRQVVRARPGATAQRAPGTAVGTARNTAAANRNTTVAHAAGPSRQAQSRQATQSRSAPTAQRTANAAVATARTTASANSRTVVAQAAGPSRQAQPRQAAQARTTPTAQRTANAAAAARTGAAANSSTVANVGGPSRQAQSHQVAGSQATGSPRAAAASQRAVRIPQTEAFKRALAKRNAAKLEANSPISAVDVLGGAGQPYEAGARGERRREPAMSNDSLAQLARLSLTRRPRYDSRGVPGGKKRAALFVGSGVFAAATAAVLTFFMLNANNSIRSSHLPLVASMQRPVSQKVFPWQPAPQQPGTAPLRTEVTATKAADLEVQAEAESDASAVEPGHPGPPPPNPPPPPSEPPSADSPGWVDE
jgi:hypothetical protein